MRWIKTTYVLSWYKKETLVYLQTNTKERKYLQSKSKKITDDVTVFNVKTATTKIASKITSDLISAKRTIDIGVLLELRLWHKHIQSLMLRVAFLHHNCFSLVLRMLAFTPIRVSHLCSFNTSNLIDCHSLLLQVSFRFESCFVLLTLSRAAIVTLYWPWKSDKGRTLTDIAKQQTTNIESDIWIWVSNKRFESFFPSRSDVRSEDEVFAWKTKKMFTVLWMGLQP